MEPTEPVRPGLYRRVRSWEGWSRPGVHLVAFLALVAVIAGGVLVPAAAREAKLKSSEEVVRAFFDAVMAGDAAAARAMVPADVESGYATDFLVPEAIRHDWRVTAMRTTESRTTAIAVVTVTGPSGAVNATVTLTRGGESDSWELTSPYGAVSFAMSSLSYGEVNGVFKELDDQSTRFLVFPGFYRFYTDRPGVLDVAGRPATVAVMPEQAEPTWAAPDGTITFGPQTLATADIATRAAIDACTADTSGIDPASCYFAASELGLKDPRDITWTVEAYPEVEINILWPPVEFGDDWAIQTTKPGRISLRGTHSGDDGPERFSLDCELTGQLYFVQVGLSGVRDMITAERSWDGVEPIHCANA
ncbi:hypothetical protein [Phytomonospora endophytica]|uniref:DUF4878 domain-containing protein n=1 Tax=Phytomonospora endophytica TaxID=714109 RepID=A0A841FV12_9ACTN|nr:hypothetical protein [Phytomonospora endophytica]MBB6038603.1 hypothetical protein [Phytomonospora endophytica]GIG69253.1 hypothetical protein Pen01_55480 [Phytomonospora endophytica]